MKLTRKDLMSLEQYSEQRQSFREKVMAHKACRRLHMGEHIVFYFESRLTMQYQIQEMLRIEKIFEAAPIQEELDAYNPMIPDGRSFRITMMIEYVDPLERVQWLKKLKGIEDTLWFATNESDGIKYRPVVNPDLPRSNEDKTAAVHFVFFDFSDEEIKQILKAKHWYFGIDHPAYGPMKTEIETPLREELLSDM